MALTVQQKNLHLLWRAGFGPMAEMVPQLDSIQPAALWNLLKQSSAKAPKVIHVAENLSDGLFKGVKDLADAQRLSDEQRKMLREQSRDGLKRLNTIWLNHMINSEAQLREKMAFFWHGHFACRVINIYFQQQLLDVIREHALGNFGDLLRAVSKSPAMLQFLNNQQNRKKQPNENFAREVMELFTMGRGNYAEQDIKEAARAFTGWGFDLRGEFVFRTFQHDDGNKTILGKTGKWTGDDVIDILLEDPRTALFIARKLYRFFVSEQENLTEIGELAKTLYDSNYAILPTLDRLFTSTWFYHPAYVGNRIKSPIELMVGIRRILPMQLSNEDAQLIFQRALGQILFYPPNVAGWPGGKTWIDSSTLMLRMRLPQMLAANTIMEINTKSDDDVQMGQMIEQQKRRAEAQAYANRFGTASIAWKSIVGLFDNTPRIDLQKKIARLLLVREASHVDQVAAKHINQSSREAFIQSAMIQYMSTPEYQLA